MKISKEFCNNCGQKLSERNIYLAIEDYGLGEDVESLQFCCPSYSDEAGCRYSVGDQELAAYWMQKGAL